MTIEMEYLKKKVYYSQNREDLLLEAFFSNLNDGFYVDAGAYDPNFDSVTKLFYEKGWRGINIEPQRERYEEFVKARRRDINLNCGVSDVKSELILRSYVNGGLSTFSNKLKKDYEKDTDPKVSKFNDVKVPVTTLKEIFQNHKVKKINFLKIDVEGLEYEVLHGNDWNRYRPEVICIESNNILKDWKKFLVKKDYKCVFFDGLNDYYVDIHSDKLGGFDYVNHIVELRGGGLKYNDYKIYEDKEKHYEHLKSHEKSQDDLIEHLKSKLVDQEATLSNSKELFVRSIKLLISNIFGRSTD